MKPKKSDTATIEDVDWSFSRDPEVLEAVEYAALRAAREFESAEFDDCQQDALLWLSVRPEFIEKCRRDVPANEFRKLLASRIYSGALRAALIAESDRNKVTSSYSYLEADCE